jgi:hypothetical protein
MRQLVYARIDLLIFHYLNVKSFRSLTFMRVQSKPLLERQLCNEFIVSNNECVTITTTLQPREDEGSHD